jgi:hypothetical protein
MIASIFFINDCLFGLLDPSRCGSIGILIGVNAEYHGTYKLGRSMVRANAAVFLFCHVTIAYASFIFALREAASDSPTIKWASAQSGNFAHS